ncbi:hypothetical protein OAA86_02380 [Rhodospirillales bacterium]|nr:hypothetical protein [Rhodospirillales bacterium]
MSDELQSSPKRRINRTVKVVLIFATCALLLRGIIFLIDDGYNMTAEEGAKLKPIETHIPEN